jgi:hypothetical protein
LMNQMKGKPGSKRHCLPCSLTRHPFIQTFG